MFWFSAKNSAGDFCFATSARGISSTSASDSFFAFLDEADAFFAGARFCPTVVFLTAARGFFLVAAFFFLAEEVDSPSKSENSLAAPSDSDGDSSSSLAFFFLGGIVFLHKGLIATGSHCHYYY